MRTIIIQIGNTDDKLTQKRWSEFCSDVQRVASIAGTVHFSAASNGMMPWQNACWVIQVPDDLALIDSLRRNVAALGSRYGQDSVAWTEGETAFV